jgi:hypothetical protein
MTETKKRARTAIPDEIKAAVLADLVLLSPATVASKHGLKPGTVRRLKSQELSTALAVLETDPAVITLKKQRITALMLEYLEANLNALTSQAYVSADPTYINRQPAGELAILHGVLADKSIRLLEALHRGGERGGVSTDRGELE